MKWIGLFIPKQGDAYQNERLVIDFDSGIDEYQAYVVQFWHTDW